MVLKVNEGKSSQGNSAEEDSYEGIGVAKQESLNGEISLVPKGGADRLEVYKTGKEIIDYLNFLISENEIDAYSVEVDKLEVLEDNSRKRVVEIKKGATLEDTNKIEEIQLKKYRYVNEPILLDSVEGRTYYPLIEYFHRPEEKICTEFSIDRLSDELEERFISNDGYELLFPDPLVERVVEGDFYKYNKKEVENDGEAKVNSEADEFVENFCNFLSGELDDFLHQELVGEVDN